MNRIKNTLLIILFLQLLIFIYLKFFYTKDLNRYNHHLLTQQPLNLTPFTYQSNSMKLPQSSEYTIWNQKVMNKLKKEVQTFNKEIKKIVQSSLKEKSIEIERDKEISITKKIEKYAKEKLGQKYVWGATGPKNFDCSGFTRSIYLCTTGIKIPRVSRDQAKVGKYVKYEELRRGDMVFFDTEKKYTGKVNHVGIYLNNGNFIHASSAKKKVIITNFKKKPFYKKRFLWGRRLIKNAS